MIKLIVCDLDGTLLNDRKQLDSQILPVLDALRKKHILFTLATGRNEAIARDYVDQLGIEIPYAADNGANLYCRHRLLQSESLQKKDSEWILTRLMEEGIPFTFLINNAATAFPVQKN